ncbi:MAG: hypothetical protein M3256_07820 [Actinomycetota bacterium]|nr:hypothetical protein [Actinomycetota bacterium]
MVLRGYPAHDPETWARAGPAEGLPGVDRGRAVAALPPRAQVHDVHRVFPDAIDLRYCQAESASPAR